MKFIPNSEYNEMYDALLFMMHYDAYCICSWEAVPNYKLQSIFAIHLVLSSHVTGHDHSGN